MRKVITAEMLEELHGSLVDNTYKRTFQRFEKPDVLYCDEFGYAPFDADATKYLFRLVSARHQTRSIILAANTGFAGWKRFFPSEAQAVDRRLCEASHKRYHGMFANRSRFRALLPVPPEAKHDKSPDADGDADAGSSTHLCDNANLHIGQTLPGEQSVMPWGGTDDCADADLDVVPSADVPHALDDDSSDLSEPPAVRPRRLPWASLLKRSLGVSGLECPKCQCQMVLLALITSPSTVAKILDHLRIPSTPPPVAPARLAPHQTTVLYDELDQTDPHEEPSRASWTHAREAAVPRAPP